MRPTDALPHPEDWLTTTVGRSVELKRGVSWSKEQEHSEPGAGRVPVIGIRNVQDQLDLTDVLYLSALKPAAIDKTRVSAGWTVMVGSNGNRARIGNAVLIREDAAFLFASFLIGAKPTADSGLSSDYFYRWLSCEQVQAYLSASSEGTTGLSNLSHSFFRAMSIPIPPSDEQTAIARILDAVDTALERTRAAVERARELKDAVLNRFVYQALGETAYADRPRRRLPNGWELVATAALLADEPKNGVSPPASSQPPGTPTFSIGAIRDGVVDLASDTNLKYAAISEPKARRFLVRSGDVLIVRGNANPDLVGKAAVVSSFPEGCIYPDIAKRVVFHQSQCPRILPAFAVHIWNHATVHNQVLRRAKTSNGTLKINNRDVKQIVLPVPPDDEQKTLVEILSAAEAQLHALKNVAAAQQQLKKSLMHDLLTGRVRVRGTSEVTAP